MSSKESKVVVHSKSDGGELGSVFMKKSSLLSPSVIKLLSEIKYIFTMVTINTTSIINYYVGYGKSRRSNQELFE